MNDERPLLLYVDDEEANRIVFDASFKAKYRIECFDNGEAALARVLLGDAAVLITDQRMPGMSGNELLRIAREKCPQTARIVVTAYDDARPILDALNSGLAHRYLVKPWAHAEVEGAIDGCLELHRLREAKLDLENRLFQAERFVTLGVISAGIFHDMSQPVLVLGSMLQPDALADPAALEDMTAAVRQLEAMASSARQFLSQAPAAGRAPGDPSEALRSALILSGKRAQMAGARVETRIAETLPRTSLSTSSLIQVVVNLVVNAAQAMKHGTRGTITVEARNERGEFVLCVADDGAGMTPDVLARVRTPFFTTKPPGEGTGLGLYTCQRMVDAAGGRLDIESQEGAGTRVTVRIPGGAR